MPTPQTLKPMAQRVQQGHLANTVLTCPSLQVCSWAALLPPIEKKKKKTKTHMVRCHEGLSMSLGHAAMAVRRTVSWDMAAWAAFIHGLQHGHFPPKCIVCYRPQARTPSLETMFLLVSVVYRPWHLGLGIIGPHGHLEKTHEWHSLGTLLLEKDTKSLLRP